MQAYILQLPLRTIHLQLNDKAQTELEASGLSAYIQLHSELVQVQQLAEQYGKEVNKVQTIINDLKKAYTALENEARKYGATAGFTHEETLEAYDGVENGTNISLKVQYLQSLLDAYCNLVDRYNENKGKADAVYAEASQVREQFDESFSHFVRTYFSPMLRGWSNLQIDTVSLDDDFEQFKELSCKIDETYDRIIDEWNATCEVANDVNSKMTKLDRHLGYLKATLKLFRSKDENSELN